MRQNKTDSSGRGLQPEQEVCMLALLEGATDQDAADRSGVSRATVQRWKSDDALFIAKLNDARQVQWDTHRARLSALQGKALDRIAQALDSEDEGIAFKAAVTVVKLSDQRPTGPTSEYSVALASSLL